jgi:hypothetical protein
MVVIFIYEYSKHNEMTIKNNKNKVSVTTKQNLLNVVWTIPYDTKGNCYVFGLAPVVGRGGFYKHRTQKARPGDKCPEWRNKPYDFKNCTETIRRVICDNPRYVTKVDHKLYVNRTIDKDHHLMAAVLSPDAPHQDFHFLRRVPITTVVNSWDRFRRSTPAKCKAQLRALQPKYVWAHQQGWSNGIKIHDAAGNLIVDPSKADFNYKTLHYSIYCGLFKVKTRHATVTTEFDL